MKLFIAFDNDGPLSKLAPSLQARGLNLIKAVPSDFPIVGLCTRQQPGYGSYSENLPAFLIADTLGKNVSLHREGYFLSINNDKLLPVNLPRIFVALDKRTKAVEDFILANDGEMYKGKNQECSATFPFKTGLIKNLINLPSRNTKAFPPLGTVSVDSYPELIQILRVISQFFRTHTYPAYNDGDDNEPLVFEGNIAGTKRKLTQTDFGDLVGDKEKAIRIDNEGTREWIIAAPDSQEVKLHWAKPSGDGRTPWGLVSDIPNTSGILFPFLTELCRNDKEMVPRILERYFLKSLGQTVEGINDRYSKTVSAWKKDIHTSEIGHILSHLALGIKVALPSQARVFPLVEDGVYLGFYLSGAHFALGLRGKLIRPVSFSDNGDDISTLGSHESVLSQIAALITSEAPKQSKWKKGCTSMAALHDQLKLYIISPSVLENIRSLLPGLHFKESPLRVSVENVKSVLECIVDNEMPKKTDYIHYLAVGMNDVFTQQLSRFGPLVPSPMIPGCPRISLHNIPQTLPQGQLAYRLTSLSSAISDWKDIVESKVTSNSPTRLNARYQHFVVRGNKEKEEWFSSVVGFVKGMNDRLTSGGNQGELLDVVINNLMEENVSYDDM